MSLILDALKQAERERKITKAPELGTIPNARIRALPPRRIRLWVFAAALVVGAFLIFIFRPEGPEPTIGRLPGQSGAMTFRESGKKDLASAGVPSRITAGEAKALAPRSHKPAPKKPVLRQERKTASTLVGPPRPVPQPVRSDVAVNTPVAEPKRREPARKADLPDRATDDQTEGRLETNAPIPEPAAPGAETNIPPAGELPPEIRESLRKLEISAHVFDEDPSGRFVFINQRSYRTGDRIGESGYLLKEITPDGIVIDYGGGQTSLQAKRPALWSE